HRRIRDREVVAVAGAHAQRPVRPRQRDVGTARRRVHAEQLLEEAARTLIGVAAVLRAAIGFSKRRQDRAARAFSIGAVALQALGGGHDAVDVRARLLHLAVDLGALRRLAAEDRKEAATLAAHLLRLLIEAVELGLLFAGEVLVTLDLGRLGRIEAAAVERG